MSLISISTNTSSRSSKSYESLILSWGRWSILICLNVIQSVVCILVLVLLIISRWNVLIFHVIISFVVISWILLAVICFVSSNSQSIWMNNSSIHTSEEWILCSVLIIVSSADLLTSCLKQISISHCFKDSIGVKWNKNR